MTADLRRRVVDRVADQLAGRRPGHPLRVAVDGITAAGKTSFADELAVALSARGRSTIRLSMDGFHHRRAHRHRLGRTSADGYYQDAYDFDSFARRVLEPLGPGGSGRYVERIIDLAADSPVDSPELAAATDAVLVVDGSFLQRGELDGRWDEIVFLDTAFDVARERGARRDAEQFGSVAAAARALDERYHAASRRYLDEVDPRSSATVVVTNDDLDRPGLVRIGGPAGATVQLFSYGTLQQEDVQRASFGRLLDGHRDTLPGHRRDWVTITDPDVIATSGSNRHPLVAPSADPDDCVDGSAFTITTEELAAADLYEVDDYSRVLVRLASGVDAWVYLAAPA